MLNMKYASPENVLNILGNLDTGVKSEEEFKSINFSLKKKAFGRDV